MGVEFMEVLLKDFEILQLRIKEFIFDQSKHVVEKNYKNS